MRNYLTLMMVLVTFSVFSQTTPPSVVRSPSTITQVDPYLTALKRLGIPTSPTDNLDATSTAQNTIKIIYNTTLQKLRVYNPVTEEWSDASPSPPPSLQDLQSVLEEGNLAISEEGDSIRITPYGILLTKPNNITTLIPGTIQTISTIHTDALKILGKSESSNPVSGLYLHGENTSSSGKGVVIRGSGWGNDDIILQPDNGQLKITDLTEIEDYKSVDYVYIQDEDGIFRLITLDSLKDRMGIGGENIYNSNGVATEYRESFFPQGLVLGKDLNNTLLYFGEIDSKDYVGLGSGGNLGISAADTVKIQANGKIEWLSEDIGIPINNNLILFDDGSNDTINNLNIQFYQLPIKNLDSINYVYVEHNDGLLKRVPLDSFKNSTGDDVTASTGLTKVGNDIQLGGSSDTSIVIDIDTNNFSIQGDGYGLHLNGSKNVVIESSIFNINTDTLNLDTKDSSVFSVNFNNNFYGNLIENNSLYIGKRGEYGFHINSNMNDVGLEPEDNEDVTYLTGFSRIDSLRDIKTMHGIMIDSSIGGPGISQAGTSMTKGDPLPLEDWSKVGQVATQMHVIDEERLEATGDTVLANVTFQLYKDIPNNEVKFREEVKTPLYYKHLHIDPVEKLTTIEESRPGEKMEKFSKQIGETEDSLKVVRTVMQIDSSSNPNFAIHLGSTHDTMYTFSLNNGGLFYNNITSTRGDFNIGNALIQAGDSVNVRSRITQYRGTEVQEYAYVSDTILTMHRSDGYSTYYLEVNIGDEEYNIPYTIVFPANPTGGMKKTVVIGSGVFGTTLTDNITWDGNGATLMFQQPTELKAGDTFIFQYFLEDNVWVRL